MYRRNINISLGLLSVFLIVAGCKVPSPLQVKENRMMPMAYTDNQDTLNISTVQWKSFFTDTYLINLIDTALKRNQELNITLQEVEMAANDIRFRQGFLQPSAGVKLSAGVEKVGRYTSQGAGDASTEITKGKEVPEVLPDYTGALFANWEVDIWNKLHNAKKAAVTRYLSTVEGRNFVVTNLIAEVANAYYELLALDNQLDIVRQNINLQNNALDIVKVQKEAARVTELAVQKFQADVYHSQSLEYDILQKINETENRINFLLARFPQHIPRSKDNFTSQVPAMVKSGIPSQLLSNRPDVKQAELELAAAKLDVKVARAEFYPSLDIAAVLGLQAFKPSYLVKFPESLLYSVAGDLAAPLINRSAIKAEFNNANARQLQAMYNYERSILNAYLEVSLQLSNIDNLGKKYDLKSKQVDALTKSIDISNNLFSSARADYLEVLMTQRDALESKLELVETKKDQLIAVVNIYRDLGGGWR
jgi:outer membrane protein, multidrug efflux system